MLATILAIALASAAADADLSSQYRLRYTSDAEGPSCPAVKVNRKGVTVRVGLFHLER